MSRGTVEPEVDGEIVYETYRICLNGQDRCTTPKNRELVLLGLRVEDPPAWQADNANFAPFLSEDTSSLHRDADFTPGAHNRQMFPLYLVHNISPLDSVLNRRVLQLGQILSRQRDNRWCRLGLKRDEVCGRGLITVGRSPEVHVGHGTEVRCSFHGLMRRPILTKPYAERRTAPAA